MDPATNGDEGTDPATTNADLATNGSRGADPSTTNNKSSRHGEYKLPPPSRADLAIASQVSGYGFEVGGSGRMCSPTIKESLGEVDGLVVVVVKIAVRAPWWGRFPLGCGRGQIDGAGGG
jgi:hypothetical protein